VGIKCGLFSHKYHYHSNIFISVSVIIQLTLTRTMTEAWVQSILQHMFGEGVCNNW